ncbi:MAG: hypothetical protein ACI33P_11250 [Lysinibacillus sp.]
MKMMKGIVIGGICGLVLSFILTFTFIIVASALSGGVATLHGERWLYYATVVPFVLTFSVLAALFGKWGRPGNKKIWLLSAAAALFIPLYSGTIGALFGEYIVRGGLVAYTENGSVGVNVEGILVWGTIYAFALLPITIPLARLILEVFCDMLQQMKLSH